MDNYDNEDADNVRSPRRGAAAAAAVAQRGCCAAPRGVAARERERAPRARPACGHAQAASLRIFGSGPLTVFRDNKDDPYITAPDAQDDDSEHELAIGDSGARPRWLLLTHRG